MTIAERAVVTPEDVIGAVAALAPDLSRRAGDIEAQRRLPGDVLDALIDAGCFRLIVPQSHGGLGADLRTFLRMLEALARADGSVGWTVMIGATAWCDVAELPRGSFDALFADGPDLILAGAFNPTGRIEPSDGGYRVSGRWAFASGCEHARWIWANCVEGFENGMPQLRIAVMPPEDVVIEDTWHVAGLRGTGSHHFRADDVHVPADRTFPTLADEPCIDEPIVRIPPPTLYPLVMAAVALGIASGSVDDITTTARDKVPLLSPSSLAAQPLFQFDLATDDTTLRAARALLNETADEIWSTAVAGEGLSLEQRAHARATGVWVTDRAAEVTTSSYRSGGGGALYSDNPLQRRLRDINALTQHFLVKRDTLTTVGAIYAGQDVDLMVF
jgi:alkylation response protein AidB-like acyl-CoA dehydrogenase